MEGFDCTSTSQNDAISVAQRMFNWAIEQQYISVSPIAKIRNQSENAVRSSTRLINGNAIQEHAQGSH